MKLTIKRVDFLKLLTFASQAIPAKTAESQYMNYLIEVGVDFVSVIASDGSISTKVTQNMKDEKGNDIIFSIEPGFIQTPARLLLDMISKLGGEIVTLEMVDTGLLNISNEISDFNLVTKAGEEYPDVNLNIPEDTQGFKVPLKDIKILFDTTSYAVAIKGPKELYQGINVRAIGGKLVFLATDSFRMASLALPEPSQDVNFVFTCPVKSLDMVTRISETGECTIYLDEQRALFVSDSVMISTRLLHGDFPSIDRLIPPAFPYSVSMTTEEFLKAAERVKIISSAEDKNSQVKLSLTSDGTVTLSARSTNYGNSQEKLKEAVATLPEGASIFEIAFNIDFVTAAVKALKSDKFTLVFTSPTKMFMAKNDDPENHQIITPIRMSSY